MTILSKCHGYEGRGILVIRRDSNFLGQWSKKVRKKNFGASKKELRFFKLLVNSLVTLNIENLVVYW